MKETSHNAGRAGDSEIVSKVTGALANPKWNFRTIEGIAKETGMADITIEKVLIANPDIFRKSPVPDRSGRMLFALASQPISWREYLATLQYTLKNETDLFQILHSHGWFN